MPDRSGALDAPEYRKTDFSFPAKASLFLFGDPAGEYLVRKPVPHFSVSRSQEIRERALTQVITVLNAEEVPHGYFRIPVKNSSIYGKVQLLSSQKRKPVFVERPDRESSSRIAYWAHASILPELARWLSYRVFQDYELVGD